ncbi:hypothetical protein Tco_0162590 [Tanacetum coccineum]
MTRSPKCDQYYSLKNSCGRVKEMVKLAGMVVYDSMMEPQMIKLPYRMRVNNQGEITKGVVSGIVVGIVPNKITHPIGVPTLSFDQSDETKITEIAMTSTSKILYKFPLYQPCMMQENNDQMGE